MNSPLHYLLQSARNILRVLRIQLHDVCVTCQISARRCQSVQEEEDVEDEFGLLSVEFFGVLGQAPDHQQAIEVYKGAYYEYFFSTVCVLQIWHNQTRYGLTQEKINGHRADITT